MSKAALGAIVSFRRRNWNVRCDGKSERKAEVVDLAVNAHEMKLAKVCEAESEDINTLIAELLTTDEGL